MKTKTFFYIIIMSVSKSKTNLMTLFTALFERERQLTSIRNLVRERNTTILNT